MRRGAEIMRAVFDRAIANGAPVIVERPTDQVRAERAWRAEHPEADGIAWCSTCGPIGPEMSHMPGCARAER